MVREYDVRVATVTRNDMSYDFDALDDVIEEVDDTVRSWMSD